ncbi:hypothetical protein FJZ18_04225 [Candidatus Pacearchaeota archaeon]|nr:hypothetical protein [Candidatus Pacearchaeota archaeon]
MEKGILVQSASVFKKNPAIILPGIGAFVWMTIYFKLLNQKKNSLPISSETDFWIWSVVLALIALIGLSFFFSYLFSSCAKVISRKTKGGLRNWPGMFLQSILFLIIFNIVWLFAQNGALLIGRTMQLEIAAAQMIFIFLYALIIISFALFFIYAQSAYALGHTWRKAITTSFKITRINYPLTLTISIVYFLLTGILESLTGNIYYYGISITEMILFIAVYPFFAILLTIITYKYYDIRTS